MLVHPDTRERVRQYNRRDHIEQDMAHTKNKGGTFSAPEIDETKLKTLMINHALQLKDMKDYYDPNGSVRRRSYQMNPETGEEEIVAPLFSTNDSKRVYDPNLALKQYDKNVPIERAWMYSPSNRIINPHSEIISHDGTGGYKLVDVPASTSGKRQSYDFNRQILQNPGEARMTALMYPNPIKNYG
jgi:hypothetical protein